MLAPSTCGDQLFANGKRLKWRRWVVVGDWVVNVGCRDVGFATVGRHVGNCVSKRLWCRIGVGATVGGN